MAYTFERSIVIGMPAEQVYDYLMDISAQREWGEMSEMELSFEGPAQVGSRWRSSSKTSSFVKQDECTITALERPHLFSFQVKSQTAMDAGNILLSYHLEPVAERTRVTFSRESHGNEAIPVLMKALLAIPELSQLMDKLITAKAVDRELVNLRDRLEGTSA